MVKFDVVMHLKFENRCITTSVKAQDDVVEESQCRLEPLNRRCDASVFKFQVHHHIGEKAPTDVVILPQRRFVS